MLPCWKLRDWRTCGLPHLPHSGALADRLSDDGIRVWPSLLQRTAWPWQLPQTSTSGHDRVAGAAHATAWGIARALAGVAMTTHPPRRRMQLLHALRDRICPSVASTGVPRGTPSPQSKWPQRGSCLSLGCPPVGVPSRCTGYTTYLISGCPAAAVIITPYGLKFAGIPPVLVPASRWSSRTE